MKFRKFSNNFRHTCQMPTLNNNGNNGMCNKHKNRQTITHNRNNNNLHSEKCVTLARVMHASLNNNNNNNNHNCYNKAKCSSANNHFTQCHCRSAFVRLALVRMQRPKPLASVEKKIRIEFVPLQSSSNLQEMKQLNFLFQHLWS